MNNESAYLAILSKQKTFQLKEAAEINRKLKETEREVFERQSEIQIPDTRKRPFLQFLPSSTMQEELVPIRLDIEVDGFRLNDTFLWNLHENEIPVDTFAQIICVDFNIPFNPAKNLIVKSIEEQIRDFSVYGLSSNDEVFDLRILIKLDIIIDNIHLVDRFEWDLNCSRNSPELFALSLCLELGLDNQFQTAISHAIREQSFLFRKSLILAGYTVNDGKIQISDDELASLVMLPVDGRIRDSPDLNMFSPILEKLTDAEIEKLELSRERESRRKRRNTRGKAILLPALSSPIKTHRTGLRKAAILSQPEESKPSRVSKRLKTQQNLKSHTKVTIPRSIVEKHIQSQPPVKPEIPSSQPIQSGQQIQSSQSFQTVKETRPFTFPIPQTKTPVIPHAEPEIITRQCLKCGAVSEQTLQNALSIRFYCDRCVRK